MNTKDEAFEWMGVLCKTICICAYLTRPRNASSPSLSLSISRHGSARLDVSFSSRCWLLFHPSIHNHPQAQQQSREWKGRAGLGWIAHHPAGQSSPINRHSLQASRYDSTMGFSFGNFDRICETAALIPCAMLADSTGTGIEPVCYARNVEINGTILFQPAVLIAHIAAIVMTIIMIMHIRSKYTAVGRKEMVFFFYLYALLELLGIFLDTAIIPFSSPVYPWFAAVHTGLMCTLAWSLMLNGFVGFQFAEDGTPLSMWSLRLSSLAVFLVTGFIAVATFKNIAGLSNTKPIALWIVYYAFTAVCIVLYVVSQLILVIRTLDDRWPIGDIIFGVAFFVAGQVLIYGFSTKICDAIKHYLDGLFFGTLCTLLAVMMVYKYYDTITKEDLEFSVGSKQNVWEVKESLLGPNASSGFGLNNTAGGGAQYDEDIGMQQQFSHPMPQYSHPSAASSYQGYGMQGYPPSKGSY